MSASNPPDHRVSLVVPAYNESEFLPRLLDTVDAARHAYRHGPASVEVIVADNCSSDDTASIAADRGCQVVRVKRRRIASVRNGGAAVARGEILCFVDADGQIHPDSFNAVEATLATGKVVAGASGVTMERLSLGIVVTYWLFMPWVWMLRMDSGLVFCRRQDFEAVGGYDEGRPVAEDVQLLVDMRRLGRTRGQKLIRLTSIKGVASTRKFDEHGDWHYLTEMWRLLPLLWDRDRRHPLVDKFWYGDQRSRS
ncbi:MAG: glycosyltransferase [Holophagae bacterium]|jgi:glycosyltransferase involved in cell wall biosynthesis